MAAHQQQRAVDGVLEPVVLRFALDEVRDDLGIGLGDERVPLALQFLLQIEVVLDDPVVDHDDLSRAVAVRVRILFRRPTVRGPTRVADAVFTNEGIRDDDLFQVRQFARASSQVDDATGNDRNPSRVVAAILEFAQAVDQDRHDVLRADVADDSTHGDPCNQELRIEN